MTEKARKTARQQLPDSSMAQKYHQTLRVFDNLIYNEDRNQGNILYDRDWKLWMIDHTRSFRIHNKLYNSTVIFRCDKDLFSRLKTLNKEILSERLGSYLSKKEIDCILKRRDLLVDKIHSMIDDRGEEKVLFDWE